MAALSAARRPAVHGLARNRSGATLAGLTDVPVVEARGIADLDALVVPSLKAAFYVNASSGNGFWFGSNT